MLERLSATVSIIGYLGLGAYFIYISTASSPSENKFVFTAILLGIVLSSTAMYVISAFRTERRAVKGEVMEKENHVTQNRISESELQKRLILEANHFKRHSLKPVYYRKESA